MTTRIREMEALTEVKELRLKVMELETQVQVSTNQLRRQDDNGKVLREELETALAREKELETKLREQHDRYTDLESKMKDDTMMARIRDAEHAQQVAVLSQKISVLELKVGRERLRLDGGFFFFVLFRVGLVGTGGNDSPDRESGTVRLFRG